MAQTFNTILSFVKSTSRKDRRKGVGSLSVPAVAGGGVGSAADSATQAWVRDNFVDKTTEQEISALKIFSQGIKIGDVSLFKHPDGYVYLDETLVLKGGVVMYGNGSGAEVPSIFDSLPIDGRTIKRDGNGALYVDETALSVSGGGGGGGVASSVHWNNVTGKPSWIGSTKPTYKYSEIEERPDLSVYFLASNFTKANIKSALDISDWALASTKPTYTASEVGALASGATAVDSSKLGGLVASRFLKGTGVIESADFNEQTAIGLYRYNSVTDKNSPADGTSYGNLLVLRSGGHDTLTQIYFNSSAKMQIFVRSGSTSNFTSRAWKTIAFTSDIPTKLSQFTDDVGYFMTKAPADTLPSLVNIAGYGYESKGWETTGPAITFGGSTYKAGFQSTYSSGALYFGFAKTSDADLGDWKRVAFTDSNVASATKLATARTIWGQSFDGTGDVSGGMRGVNAVVSDTTNGYYVGNRNDGLGVTDGGLLLYTYGNTPISLYTDTTERVRILPNGNVAIGGTTASAKLHVHGTAKFTGDTTFSSKVVIGTIPVYQSADGTLFVDANVVFRGGVAMFGNTTTTVNEE